MTDEIKHSTNGSASVPVSAPVLVPEPVPVPVPAPASAPPQPGSDVFDGDEASPEIPGRVVLATSILTGACIIFAMVLCVIVIRGAMNDRASELTIRLLMSCIACFIGLAFASLGFGLFLLRARGRFRARIDGGSGGTERPTLLESTAPGLVVIVCATVVIWLSLSVRFEKTTTTTTPVATPAQALPAEHAPTVVQPSVLPHVQDGVPKAP